LATLPNIFFGGAYCLTQFVRERPFWSIGRNLNEVSAIDCMTAEEASGKPQVRFFAAKALNVFARSNVAFGAIFLPNAHNGQG